MADGDPADRAALLLQRASALLLECRGVAQRLAQAPEGESQAAEAERTAYGVLVALEEGFVNTLEHAAGLLKSSFKTTEGVIAEKWLREQERKLGQNGPADLGRWARPPAPDDKCGRGAGLPVPDPRSPAHGLVSVRAG